MKYALKYDDFLLEKLLASDFSIGFELEGIIGSENSNKDILNIFSQIDEIWGSGSIQYESDIFKMTEYELDILDQEALGIPYRGFEYNSPVLKYNLTIYKKLENLLLNISKFNIFGNERTAFHVHFSYPNMDSLDSFWILCKIALDKDIKKKILKIGDINQFGSYLSRFDILIKLKNSILKKDLSSLYEIYDLFFKNNDGDVKELKKLLFRIHPIGTLEWRGPRSFMYKDVIKNVPIFMKTLHNLILFMSNAIESDHLADISKKEFLNVFINKKKLF